MLVTNESLHARFQCVIVHVRDNNLYIYNAAALFNSESKYIDKI